MVEHAAGDLVAIVRAGTPMGELQAVLATAGQQLALDTPLAAATLGGTVATNTSGPRRLLYGTMRDLLIGITFVRADGVVARAGGKVVKNVAGYDFGKLLTGSYGTLGVITEVALRLHPLPRARQAVSVPDDRRRGRRRGGAAGGPVAGRPLGGRDRPAGRRRGRSHRARRGRRGGGRAPRRRRSGTCSGRTSSTGDVPRWFGAEPFGTGDVGLKITTHVDGTRAGADGGPGHEPPDGVPCRSAGRRWASCTPRCRRTSTRRRPAAWSRTCAAPRAEHGGSVVVLTAPPPVRDALDMWGPVARAGPDAPAQGAARPGPPAGARPLRRRNLMTASPAFDDHRPPSQDLVDDCVHCGFCLPTCPTYSLWGEEMDSPRGRIYLMNQGLNGEPLTDSMVRHFDACLGCMACVTACPSGVQYDRLIEATRRPGGAAASAPADRPAAARRSCSRCSPTPGGCGCCGSAAGLPAERAVAAGRAACWPGCRGSRRSRPSRRSWAARERIPERLPATGPRRAVVGMLLGCVQREFFPQVNAATARVLQAEGCDVVVPRRRAAAAR